MRRNPSSRAFKWATDMEALTRAVEKVDPRIVRELKDRLARIDGSNLTDDQKKTEKIKYFFERQDDIEKLTKAAHDSGIATEQGLDELRLIRDYVRVQFFIEVNNNPVQNALTVLSYSSRTALRAARQEIDAERRREAGLDSEDGIAPEHSSAGQPEITVALGGGIGERQPQSQTYLATDRDGVLSLGVVGHDRDVTETSFDVSLRYAGDVAGLQPASASAIVIEPYFGYSSGDSDGELGDYQVAAGVFLGIPGTGDPSADFPAGITLANNIVSNDVSDIVASYDWEEIRAGVRIGAAFAPRPDVSITPFVGFGYVHTSEDESFAGRVAAFGLDFGYRSKLELDTFRLDLGARFESSLGPSWSIFAEPSASLNFIDKSGFDSLDFAGLVNEFQSVDLDGSETLAGVKLAVGLDYEPQASPFSLHVGAIAAYEPNTATIHRSGELDERSVANVDYSFSYGVKASAVFKLY